MPNYILFTIPKIMIMVGFLLNVGGILTWVDRRQSAMIQDRVGPNRAVIKIGKLELRLAGLLHPAADGVKLTLPLGQVAHAKYTAMKSGGEGGRDFSAIFESVMKNK